MRLLSCFIISVIFSIACSAHAADTKSLAAITEQDVDWSQCAVWVDGKLLPAVDQTLLAPWLGVSDADAAAKPWSTPEAASEARHFRIVFKKSIEVGTLCCPAERVAVLRDDAKLPGDVTNEAEWRTLDTGFVRTLDVGSKVRALRVTIMQYNLPWDAYKRPATFPGMWLLKDRFFSPAEFSFHEWSRVEAKDKKTPVLEWSGYWPTPLKLNAIVVARPYSGPAAIGTLGAKTTKHPRLATAEDWQASTAEVTRSIGSFPTPIATSALRFSPEGELSGGKEDRRSPPDVFPLVRVGNDQPSPSSKTFSFMPKPPVAANFKMPLDGFIAVRIEDEKGQHVRRLISEVERSKGNVAEPWDLLDDRNRYVTPGKYRFVGLARPPLKLTYEMTVYNAGQPPWMAPVPGGGWWMADHSPPYSVCSVGDVLFFGAGGAEFGVPLIATDREGKKLWHDLHQGAVRLVSDGRYAYIVNDGEVIRIDPQAGFKKQPLHKFAYSQELPGHPPNYVVADNSGAATNGEVLCVSYNAASMPWIRPAIGFGTIDYAKTQPRTLPAKRHETDLTPEEEIASTFQATTSSLAAKFGPTPKSGPLKHSLMLVLKHEVPLGSLVLPPGVRAYALRTGKEVPADVGAKSTPDDPTVLAEKPVTGDDLAGDLLDAIEGQFDDAYWQSINEKARPLPSIAVPQRVTKTKALLFSGENLHQLDFG